MKSNDQILLEDAYAKTYGIRKVRDSEVEQMIEDINAVAKINSRVEEMHHGHLELLKQHLEPLQKSLEETLQQINSRLNPSAS